MTRMSGFDVLVQSEAAGSCRGFRNVAVTRPVRLLVRTGTPGSTATRQDCSTPSPELSARLVTRLTRMRCRADLSRITRTPQV
jgi:hypothetical protein